MKTMKRVILGIAVAIPDAAMYRCFLRGVDCRGKNGTAYMILSGIFCVSVWIMVTGTIWYVKWLRRTKTEYKDMLDILLKSTDKLDK